MLLHEQTRLAEMKIYEIKTCHLQQHVCHRRQLLNEVDLWDKPQAGNQLRRPFPCYARRSEECKPSF